MYCNAHLHSESWYLPSLSIQSVPVGPVYCYSDSWESTHCISMGTFIHNYLLGTDCLLTMALAFDSKLKDFELFISSPLGLYFTCLCQTALYTHVRIDKCVRVLINAYHNGLHIQCIILQCAVHFRLQFPLSIDNGTCTVVYRDQSNNRSVIN